VADIKRDGLGPAIAGLIASGVLFFAGLFVIAELFLQLAGPVDSLFGKNTTEGLRPSTLDYAFQELWSIAVHRGLQAGSAWRSATKRSRTRRGSAACA